MEDKICIDLQTDLFPLQKQDDSQFQVKALEILNLIDPSSMTYGDFFEYYLIRNRPCVFTKNLTKDWNSRKDWTKLTSKIDSQLDINFEFLSQKYGDQEVDITNCNEIVDYGSSSSCQKMTINDFIKYWKEYREKDYPSTMPCFYLKDWHVMKNYSEDKCQPYKTPIYFASDWLNEYCDDKGDDFKFTYMGPKTSWTPFHCDVYGSFSWSANVIGTKKWHLYPPGREKLFRNPKTGRIEYDFKNPGIRNFDYYEVLQEAGQVVFVPSGWHHVVWNLEDTISINHNWMNGVNINFIWTNLRSALDDVEKELHDLKNVEGFSEISQGLLKAHHGMNYSGFRNILLEIQQHRQNPNHTVDGCHYFGPQHIQFDIKAVENALRLFEQDKRYNTEGLGPK